MVESRNVVGDANVLYYPWGDSRWRPYGSIGLGIAGFHYVDDRNRTVNHTGLSLPLGLGVKYLCRKWLAMRLDIKDNIVFGGNGLDATNNLSLVAGVEIHWGPKSSCALLSVVKRRSRVRGPRERVVEANELGGDGPGAKCRHLTAIRLRRQGGRRHASLESPFLGPRLS